ncbi:ABC transporter ATP-binding protein [Microvirga sp. GCM10011540]|uniref:ABC transporter ATP-binding protein n=1 Tax=Microvirga sp. GCM10011540 TaxID=3317338 RepID=UPI00361E5917
MTAGGSILTVRDLTVRIISRRQAVEAVKGISFDIKRGEAVGFVGESGCGKSVTARAIMRLAPEGMRVDLGGSVHFDGRDLVTISETEMRDIRGRRIAMVFQDPMTSLNPVITVGAQIEDMLRRHTGLSGHAARERAIELLDQVGIPFPIRRVDDYPHHFSGGMRQRVLIAIAISCDPDLLIADEPTTALDVTVQAQILRLLLRLREERSMSLMLITHDFGVVAGMVERVNVMYGGRIVETAGVDKIFRAPVHEYTRALLDSVPRLHRDGDLP